MQPAVAVPLAHRRPQPAGQTPLNCRFAYVAGTVRNAPRLDAAGLLWTCQLRDAGADALFASAECRACPRWRSRDGCTDATWQSDAAQISPSPESRITSQTYLRGAAIVQEGAAADVLHTVVEGSAMLVKRNPAGRLVGIDVVVRGNPIGADWILAGIPCPATAVAIERTRCVAIPKALVLALLSAQPPMVRELLAHSSDHEQHLIERIAVAGSRVETRYAHLLLALAARLDSGSQGPATVRIPLLRHDLAALTGTTVETAIRVMSRWDKHGIVTSHPGGFVIKDRQRLGRFLA